MTEEEEHETLLETNVKAGAVFTTTTIRPRRWLIVAAKLAIMMLSAAALYFTLSHQGQRRHGASLAEFISRLSSPSSSSSFSCNTAGGLPANRTFDTRLRFSEGAHITTPLSPPADFGKYKKWAVSTARGQQEQMSEAVMQFVKQEDWALVIVSEESQSMPQIRGPSVAILDAAAQQLLQTEYSELLDLLPWDHFGRKNVGYLYAIIHGAEMIWDFDERSVLKDENNFPNAVRDQDALRLIHFESNVECPVFNPLATMMGVSDQQGTPSLWPRGFPLDLIQRQPCRNTYVEPAQPDKVTVFQSLSWPTPDADAQYKLTHGPAAASLGPRRNQAEEFEDKTLVVPEGTFAPYNAQASLVMQPGLWTLLLPITVREPVSDIWRSYVAQRLLWDIGLQVAFMPPLVDRRRPGKDEEDLIAELEAEQDLYLKGSHLVASLRAWRGSAPTLEGRYEELMVKLYEQGFVEYNDVLLAQAWISALGRAGYRFPTLSSHALEANTVTPVATAALDCPRVTRIFITGINGVVGSHVARALVGKPCHTIYGLVRPRSNLDTLVGILDQLTLLRGDLMDSRRILSILEEVRPDYIYHLAAQSINGLSYAEPELTMDVNVEGTMNILEGVRRLSLKPRILLAGSSCEYGRTADEWNGPIPETAPLEPVTPYGVSKLAMEKLGKHYYMSYGMQVITARFFLQVGVGATDTLAIHEFCKQVAMAEEGVAEPIIYHGNLRTTREITDCRDSAPVVVAVAEKGVPGEAYNIGSNKVVSTQDLIDTIISLSTVPIRAVPDPSRLRAYDVGSLLSDNRKVKALTGWKPSTRVDETIEHTLNYWREQVSSLYAKNLKTASSTIRLFELTDASTSQDP